jgi:hypothetical protein
LTGSEVGWTSNFAFAIENFFRRGLRLHFNVIQGLVLSRMYIYAGPRSAAACSFAKERM